MYIEREIEKDILKWIDSRDILIIRGPRQSGKTTILNRIREVLKEKNSEENIHYITFEDDITRLKFQENPKEFIQFIMKKEEKNYFLLDEVQYVKDIGKHLKLLYDIYENTKIIISGSSSFDLTELGSFLVGRALFFDIYPFSFTEFLRAKGKKYEEEHTRIQKNIMQDLTETKKTLFLDELNKLLEEYLTFGSYPRIVLEPDREKKKELLQNLFTTYVEKDIVIRY